MDWEYYSKTGITIPMDTSKCGFQPGTAPKYFTPLTGKYSHWKTTDVTAIYDQDYDSFRACVSVQHGHSEIYKSWRWALDTPRQGAQWNLMGPISQLALIAPRSG